MTRDPMMKRLKPKKPGVVLVTNRPHEPGRKRPVRYVPAPSREVEQLVAAAKAHPEYLATIIALFDRTLPNGGAENDVEYHEARLPRALHRPARRLLQWSLIPDRGLDGPWFARNELADERARRIGESPIGDRARAMIERAKRRLPAAVAPSPHVGYGCYNLLQQWNGRLVNQEFIELIAALGATKTTFVERSELVDLKPQPKRDESPIRVILDYGCIVVRVDAEVPRLGIGEQSDPTIHGKLCAWTDFGMEGMHAWLLIGDDGRRRFLKRGDQLTIFADPFEEKVAWKGRIYPQSGSGSERSERGRKQRRVDGYLIPWVQRGVDRTIWTGYFFRRPSLRAKVVPKVE